jgi:glycosyl hydrolase family 26
MKRSSYEQKIRAILIRRITFLLLFVLGLVVLCTPEWRRAVQRAVVPVLDRVTGRQPAQPAPPPSMPSPPPEESRPEPSPPEEDTRPEAPPEEAVIPPAGNLPPRLPAIKPAPPLPPHLRDLQAKVKARPSAYNYRRLADAAAAAGFPDLAAEAYMEEARLRRKMGDPNGAAVEELKAGRYRSETRLYLHAPGSPPDSASLERLEPPYGALLGAFIDRDDQLPSTFMDENFQTHREEAEFAERTGKGHASLFCYLSYEKPFPAQWANHLRDAGVVPHIAWEPRRLADVNEDSYLTGFARALAQFDAPVFIRFAGEMNGEWTPYHGNPALYREKFRLVHRVISREAPKAAMIWCVNNIPDAPIDSYYPGDHAVDWVGVNMYNVLYFDNIRSRPADHVHPADLLKDVYRRYADRKPIAICEYAASHRSALDNRPRPEFAIARLSQLYGALPRLFPRVKLIDWFDCNNLKHARPDRQLNNYSLTEDPEILEAYRKAISPDYFLSRIEDRPGETIRPLETNEPLEGIVTLSAWVRTPVERPRIYILAGEQVLYAGDEPGPAVCRWNTRRAKPGLHTIRLLAIDANGRLLREERRQVSLGR